MNSREQARMERLERENVLLREQIAKHMQVYGDVLVQVIELKAKLAAVEAALQGDGPPAPPRVLRAPLPPAGVANW